MTDGPDDYDLSTVDREALERAIALTLGEDDKPRVEQVKDMLPEDPWFEVASFCSYHRQIEALRLKPWESPPSSIDPDAIDSILARGRPRADMVDKEHGGARLLRRMLALGVSAYDPTPLASIARAKRGKA
jgi:hypothetical protein